MAKPLDVTIFSRKGCPHCARAKAALRAAGIDFEELVLNKDYTDRTLRAVSTHTTFPQVFVNGENIGGADEIEGWLKQNKAA
jgi:glutaredoxin-like protein